MMSGTPQAWSVRARNLPEHADNPIHTDEGGRAAGFSAALVAGVTVHAYMVRPVVEAWGEGWLATGSSTVEFLAPVEVGDLVDCVPEPVGNGSVEVRALVDDDLRARLVAHPPGGVHDMGKDWSDRPLSERLPDHVEPLVDQWINYAERAGADLALCAKAAVVHPSVWPALANGVMTRHLVDGSWIHTSSRIAHHAAVPVGVSALVEATVVDRFDTRSGSRAVVDVRISVDGLPVVTIEHEALVSLGPTAP